MTVVLILYGIFASALLVGCTMSLFKPSVNYVTISSAKLAQLRQWREDLIIFELRGTGKGVIPGALSVSADQAQGLVRWMPPRTTLVLCGTSKISLCRDKIDRILVGLGIEVVYVLEDGRGSSMHCTVSGDPSTVDGYK